MTIKATCSGCGKNLNAKDRLAGKRVRCPECRTAIEIPTLDLSDLPDDPFLDPDLDADDGYGLSESQTGADAGNEAADSTTPAASSSLPNVASEPSSLKKKKRKKQEHNAFAFLIALVSVGWLGYLFERSRNAE